MAAGYDANKIKTLIHEAADVPGIVKSVITGSSTMIQHEFSAGYRNTFFQPKDAVIAIFDLNGRRVNANPVFQC